MVLPWQIHPTIVHKQQKSSGDRTRVKNKINRSCTEQVSLK